MAVAARYDRSRPVGSVGDEPLAADGAFEVGRHHPACRGVVLVEFFDSVAYARFCRHRAAPFQQPRMQVFGFQGAKLVALDNRIERSGNEAAMSKSVDIGSFGDGLEN